MICKKCGAKIEDNSKFCGYCGNKVEEVEISTQSSIENIDTNNVVELNNSFNNYNDLEETTRIEVIQPNNEVVNEQPVVDTPVMNNNQMIGQMNQPINEQPMMNNQAVMNNQMPTNNIQNNNTNKKNNNKLILIISGIALAVIAIVIVALAVTKSSSSSISILKKSLANLEEKSSGSLTLDAKLTMESTTGESFSFSATMKVETANEDKGKLQLTINKSMFFDEINAYAVVNEDEVTLYAKSDLIDMLGYTQSETPIWLNYKSVIEDSKEDAIEEKVEEIDLIDLIDEEHFVFIDETNDVKHYQLVIDQKLVDNMKTKLKDIEDEDIKDMINSIETIETPVKLDFYINKSNELTKIALDLASYMEENSDFKKFEISFEFSGLNSTKVEIPNEAEKSTIDFETYMSTYPSYDYNYDIDSDFYYNSDSNLDSNLDSDYDFSLDYDTTLNTDLNNTVYGF